MDALTSGTLLADRYRIAQRVESDLVDVEAWSAEDLILERTVRIAVLTGPRAEIALDEARRAALVTDRRLARVLDVGTAQDRRYAVLEDVTGATLTGLVVEAPLPAAQARAIVGEAASALEAARTRGLHHLALRPDAVRITDGRVIVTGLGIDGALQVFDRSDALSDSRADAVGLVSLLFYALTARWPGHHLEELRLRPELLPPTTETTDPRELVPDVPDDLAQRCVETLAHDRTAGPRTAGDVADRLEPWGAVTATPPPVFSAVTPVHTTSDQQTGAAEAPDAPRRIVRQSIRSAQSTSAPRPGTPPPAAPRRTSRVLRTSILSSGAAAGGAAGGAAAGSGASGAAPAAGSGAPSARSAARTSGAGGTAGSAIFAPTTPGRPGGDTAPGGGASPMSFDDLVESPREFRRFRFNPTSLTLIIVLVAVLVGALLAFQGVRDGLSSPFSDQTGERPVPTAEETGEDEAEEPEPEPTTTTPPVRPVIASGQQLDPMGDGNEHPEAVDRAYDGDPSTYWFTRTYNSATFAGMNRTGIGYAVELEEPALVSTIYLSTNNTGGEVEIRAVDADDPTEGSPLAVESFSEEMTITLDEPVETQSIVLWFPELPQAADGGNRVELREISIT
ncbi:MAG: protein kinase family protein [Cellulomonadaceae bacterium]